MCNKTNLLLISLLAAISLSYFRCFIYDTKVYPLVPNPRSGQVNSPTKAHLNDGSVIIFKDGFGVGIDQINGSGELYNIDRQFVRTVDGVALDSVAFMEQYRLEVEPNSALGGVLGPAIFGLGLTNERIKKAIFGSCPTIYACDGENYSLQAECFSYSICAMAENADLDRIDRGQALNSEYRIKITNEALETHYINLMQLLYVDHKMAVEAFPTDDQDIVLLGPENLIEDARDKNGLEIMDRIGERDNIWYQSDSSTLTHLTSEVIEDWIELRIRKPAAASRIVLAFRLRNTLFNTVFFYDVMLRSAGLRSLDWMAGRDMNPLYAWQFNNWYRDHFGLKIQIRDGREFETVHWVGDCGPIAWRQCAVNLDVPGEEYVRIRLAFLPDNWMIDWVSAGIPEKEAPVVYQADCQRLTKIGTEPVEIEPAKIAGADDAYFVTYPAESYQALFHVSEEKPELRRTYFLKSQGYYIEWIRREWFRAVDLDAQNVGYSLNDDTIVRTARLWQAKKHTFEKEFFSSRISGSGRVMHETH